MPPPGLKQERFVGRDELLGVSERLFRLSGTQIFQAHCFLRRMRPPLPAAADALWRCVAARCCTS